MKNQKYKLKGEMQRDLERVRWRNLQVDICGWCMIAMFWMIVIASLTGCTTATRECSSQEKTADAVATVLLGSQGWGYVSDCE